MPLISRNDLLASADGEPQEFISISQDKTPLTATAKRVYSHDACMGLRPRSVAEIWPAKVAGLFRSTREFRRD